MAEHARKIRRAVILAALVVVVVGGFLVGRAGVGLVTGHGDKRPPAKARVSQPAVAAQVASRPVAGARRGFRLGRSRDGAAAAAGIFATRIVGFALAGHLAREGEYGRITTSRARASLLALADSSEQVEIGRAHV